MVSGQPADDESREVRTIGARELERRGAHSAAEALEPEPALYGSSGRRGERTFSLRGFDQHQVPVLIDGAPAYAPYSGLLDLSLLPADMIDHVSVIKGPAPGLLGGNGMGGAINIVTRRPGTGPLLGLIGELGRADALRVTGLHSANAGPLRYSIFAGLRRQAAYPLPSGFPPGPRENGVLRANSDRRLNHFGASLELPVARSHTLSGSLTLIDGEHGVPPGLADPVVRYWRFTVWRSLNASLGHRAALLGGRLQLDELLYLRLLDNLLDSYDDPSYRTQSTARAFHTWYHDRLLGGRARARHRLERTPWGPTELRLAASVEHDRHQEESGGIPLEAAITRTLLGLGPEAEAFIGERWSVLLGLQLDLEAPGSTPSGALGSTVGVGPLLAASFDPLPSLSLRGSVARRTRFPTLRDRFTAALGTRVPNPELGPESALHFGIDASFRGPAGLIVRGSLYDAEVSDLIDLARIGNGLEQLRNISAARLLGCEISVEIDPLRWLRLLLGYAFLHARREEAVAGSLELAYRPAHKATVELVLKPRGWLELQSLVRVVGTRAYQHPATDAWESLGPYVVWDAGLTLRPTRWTAVWLRASNLLDALVETELGYPEPGREVWVGVRVSYDQPGGRRRRY